MKIIGKNLLVLLLSLISFAGMANQNNDDDTYTSDVKHLFQINGSEISYKQTIKAMINHFRSQKSDVPDSYWSKAEEEFLNTSLDDLMELIVPIYRKNLSHQDILAMIKFYESEAGQRIANKIPVITSESMQAGMIWGQSIGKKIHDDIESKGYKIRLPFTP